MKQFVKVMKALSDPNRVKNLKLLQHGSLCVREMQPVPWIAQPTVSNHLKVLEDAGRVSYRKNGLWVSDYPAAGCNSPYSACFLGNLKHWLKEDPGIARLMECIPSLNREAICGKQSA